MNRYKYELKIINRQGWPGWLKVLVMTLCLGTGEKAQLEEILQISKSSNAKFCKRRPLSASRIDSFASETFNIRQ